MKVSKVITLMSLSTLLVFSSMPVMAVASAPITKTFNIISDADDAFQMYEGYDFGYYTGMITNTAGNISGGTEGRLFNRYNNISIPKNAIIESAYLKVRAGRFGQEGPVQQLICANAVDNAVIPTEGQYSLATAIMNNITTATVIWEYPEMIDYTWYVSPDIKSVVQEIVNRAGWVENNSLMIMTKETEVFTGNNREIRSYRDEPLNAIQLVITYSDAKEVNQDTQVLNIATIDKTKLPINSNLKTGTLVECIYKNGVVQYTIGNNNAITNLKVLQ